MIKLIQNWKAGTDKNNTVWCRIRSDRTGGGRGRHLPNDTLIRKNKIKMIQEDWENKGLNNGCKD